MIDSAQDSAHFFKIDPAIVAKWQASGLLEGLEKTKAEKMAMLLDNEARWLIRTDENIQKAYTNVALPLVRRIFAEFDYDVTITPAYIGNDNQARTVEVFDTKCSIYSLAQSDLTGNLIDAEYEIIVEAANKIISFLKEKTKNRKMVLYIPIVLTPVNASGYSSILIRGNFI